MRGNDPKLRVWCHCSQLVRVAVHQMSDKCQVAGYDGEMHAPQLHESTQLPSICSLSRAHFLFSRSFGGAAEIVRFIKFICPAESTKGTWPPVRADPRHGRKKPLRSRLGLCMSVCVPVWSSQKGLIQTDCNRREQMAHSSTAKSILLLLLLCCFWLKAGVFSPSQRV